MYQEEKESTSQHPSNPSVIGWMGDSNDGNNDRNLVEYCSRTGSLGYHFMNYPVGGMRRASWRPEKDKSPPAIDLPDLQLGARLWSTYITGRLSPWIDCDSSEEWLAELSRVEIEKELNYVNYLPMRLIIIELKHRDSPQLAKILSRWLWTTLMNFSFWVLLPTDDNRLPISGEKDTRDMWGVWADFRTLCANYTSNRLALGLRICADLADEFLDPCLYRRWNTEPLVCFCIESSVFTCGPGPSESTIPPAHYRLLSDLFTSLTQRLIICSVSAERLGERLRVQFAAAVRRMVNEQISRAQEPGDCTQEGVLLEYIGHQEYIDNLQVPLQPLADNLDSTVYTTFEEDKAKYEKYREAVGYAIPDLVKIVGDSRDIVVYLLGAGRGPLIDMIIEAETQYNANNRSRRDLLKLQLVAVEKNVNAVVTLRFRNDIRWGSRVTLVESDMRELSARVNSGELPKPDLIVSELLGSFGDNELCPECLDGVTDILRPTTVSIPTTYTSYVAPIQSVRMYQNVLGCVSGKFYEKGLPGHGRPNSALQSDGSYALPTSNEVSPLDEIYVVYMRAICRLDKPKPVFTFSHPNFKKLPNTRQCIANFDIDMPSELMGFAAYFAAHLYGNSWLSILPESHSRGMFSWFPALIPLRGLLRLNPGAKVDFHIERKVDEGGVWYEWFVEYKNSESEQPERTPLQNENGMSYYMRF